MRDVAPDLGRGRGAERGDPRRPEQAHRLAEPPVVGPEVVTPLRDAVSLVDRDQAEPAGGRAQRVDEPRAAKPLGRDVDQRVDPGADPVEDLALLVGAGRRGQGDRRDADRAQRVDLVLHQGDQRRDHQRDVAALREHDRRELITQRFSGARGHDRDHRPAREHVADDVGLPGPQRGVAEHAERSRQHVGPALVRGGRHLQHGGHPIRAVRHPKLSRSCPKFGHARPGVRPGSRAGPRPRGASSTGSGRPALRDNRRRKLTLYHLNFHPPTLRTCPKMYDVILA